MTVHFIGAGPGASDLITVRGLRLIQQCEVVLYAGSLVPADVVAEAPEGAVVRDTAAMTLEDILALMLTAHERGQDVARVHSGDPSIYGAIAEQMRRLDAAGVDYAIVPGVPAYAAAAASLKRELTLPEIAQSVVITRMPGGASAMPPGERLEAFARTGATLAIHLAIRRLREIVSTLTPHYGSDCPVAVVYRASWPDELVLTGTLEDIQPKVREAKITRTALVLVGPALAAADFQPSRLYAPDYQHILRHRGRGRSDSESGGP